MTPSAAQQREVDHHLPLICRELGIRPPRVVWAVPDPGTLGLVNVMEPDTVFLNPGLPIDEVAGVLAHECKHVQNARRSLYLSQWERDQDEESAESFSFRYSGRLTGSPHYLRRVYS